jgi:hypothetical protein
MSGLSTHSNFQQTWLWRHAFVHVSSEASSEEQAYFSDRYLAMREKVGRLLTLIPVSMPDLTVHDMTHLDALWEMASMAAEGAITINPAEAFVFGAAILLHDAALSVAAYSNGLVDLKQTIEWKDIVVSLANEAGTSSVDPSNPPKDIVELAIPIVLRQLHAVQASQLAKQGWSLSGGGLEYLIDDSNLREFYGETIGQIAHSHWWPISRVEEELSGDLGAFPSKTSNRIDKIKLACLLRISDALHLDQRRAPRFLRTLVRPAGVAALHWTFQERLATPHIVREEVIFTSSTHFSAPDADAWWLMYDTVNAVDQELQDVDRLMLERGKAVFKARKVKGARSPEALSRTVCARGWRPVDTQLKVSDIPKVIHTLGGAKLYGDDPTIVLRELLQNSADAIQARRRYEGRKADWGEVTVSLLEDSDGHWLKVEDNGIGMSERVLTGPLIDFGNSFWKSPLAAQEFPGLISSGMSAIGRFGIGFFSVFMLGKIVRVTSLRCGAGSDTAKLLEFRDGTASRPILLPAARGGAPLDGGTRVEVLLKKAPRERGGLLYNNGRDGTIFTLRQLVAAIAPSLHVAVDATENGETSNAVKAGDWLSLTDEDLVTRLNPSRLQNGRDGSRRNNQYSTMKPLVDEENVVVGHAAIVPKEHYSKQNGLVTVGGLRAAALDNVQGLLLGEGLTASRNSAVPIVTSRSLATWASEQARLIAATTAAEPYKAACAEVVLECGGEIDTLPIIRRGEDEWLNSAELCSLAQTITEVAIVSEVDLNYDEDEDQMHPKEFRDSFELSNTIFVIPHHDGSILSVGAQSWPRSIVGKNGEENVNLENHVRRILGEIWPHGFDEDSESREVGYVDREPVIRRVYILTRNDPPEEAEEESAD